MGKAFLPTTILLLYPLLCRFFEFFLIKKPLFESILCKDGSRVGSRCSFSTKNERFSLCYARFFVPLRAYFNKVDFYNPNRT